MVDESLAAAERLADRGISVEVIDPRTIAPLDLETIVDSVRKTMRVVVTHDAHKHRRRRRRDRGPHAWSRRSTTSTPRRARRGLDVPIPCAPGGLVEAVYPTADSVIVAVERLLRLTLLELERSRLGNLPSTSSRRSSPG